MRLIVFVFGILSFSVAISQNVGISNGVITPDVSAGLEVRYTNKGVLMPRVALTSVSDAATIPSPANSLIVFNTGAGGLAPDGYYYNQGTPAAPNWVRIANGNSLDDAWQLLGNSGTNPVTNFLGTTDAQPLVLRTNNTEWARVQTDGTVSIGTNLNNDSRLSVLVPTTNTTDKYGIYNYHFGSTPNMTFALYNYNASNTNNSKYGMYNRVNPTGTGPRFGIYNYVEQNSSSNSSSYGIRNYLTAYGTGSHYANYNYLQLIGSGVSANNYASYNDMQIFTPTNTSTVYGEYTYVGYSSGIRYGEYKNINTNSSYTANAYGDYNHFYGTGNGTAYAVYNDIELTGTGSKFGVYNEFANIQGSKFSVYNFVPSGTASGNFYGLYNNVSNDGTGYKYGVYNYFSGLDDGTTYGLRNYILPGASHNDAVYGTNTYISSNGTGLHYGAYLNVPGGTNDFAIYTYAGNAVFNDGGGNYDFRVESDVEANMLFVDASTNRVGVGTATPSARLNVHGSSVDIEISNIDETDAGIVFNDHQAPTTQYAEITYGCSDNDLNFLNASATPRMVVESSGEVGIGTDSPNEKLHVVGNAKATGYITAGTASTGTIARYGSQEVKWEGYHSVHGTTSYYSIGTFVIPSNIPVGTTIYIDRIVWETDGYHTDGNESYSLYVKIGASGYYGWTANAGNGAMFIDWHYDSGNAAITNFTTNQTVTMRMYDNDPWLGGSDDLRIFLMHCTFYYHYSSPLQPGDISASGRIYANNNEAVGDLAEHFEYRGPIVPGYVVSYVSGSDNEYVLCEEPYSNHITGVISENPSVVLNSPEQGPPLALAGRVNVKLVDSDELIKGGDFVTSSSVPGFAMKATLPGPVIGYAVKNQKQGEDFVEILLQPGKFYMPPKYMDFDDNPDAVGEEDDGERIQKGDRPPGKY